MMNNIVSISINYGDQGTRESGTCVRGLRQTSHFTHLHSRYFLYVDSRYRENIGRHAYLVVLKFFVERTDFTQTQMSTNKQLNIIVNNKQRN